ncbi:tetratricopeptide repeat protein [Thermoflexus sp.]|uniref:tetratricopeptide repeat protein n=1 Tax=Thermoflexus sp. TaxID=1969742 RepID=UPI0026110DD6|nr:tetratricopeptide repeat protein [Thermoflexus sp.]
MVTELPIARTKLHPPVRRGPLLDRPRLLNFLHENIDKTLILISAPAGYGKTSLLVQFYHDTDLPVAWYSLDETDQNTHRFAEHLVAALRERFPAFGRTTIGVLRAGAAPDAVATAMINDMLENIPDYFAIVLDDYHVVAEHPGIQILVRHLLEHAPEHLHILLASRGPHGLPLTRLVARQQATGLGAQHLAFTPEEIHALFTRHLALELSEVEARALARETEGWITAILLLAQHIREEGARPTLRPGEPGTLYRYLEEEALARQPPELQEFLLETAILPIFNVAACNAIRGRADSARWIEEADRRQLFLIQVETTREGPWYRYHHLFRDFLNLYLRERDPGRYQILHQRAGRWFAGRGDAEAAVPHFLEAGDLDAAVEAMEGAVRGLFAAGRLETLGRWFRALPPDRLRQAPRLLLYQAKMLADTGRPEAALALLEQAAAVCGSEDGLTGMEIEVQRASTLNLMGRYAEAVAAAEAALARGRPEWAHPMASAYRLRGFARLALGRPREAEHDLRQAMALFRALEAPVDLVNTLIELAEALRAQDRLVEMDLYLQEALTLARTLENPRPLTMLLNNVGYTAYTQCQFEAARRYYEEGLGLARQVGDRRAETFLLIGLADLARDEEQLEEALEAYRAALEIAREIRNAFLMAYGLEGMGRTLRLQGKPREALPALQEAAEMAAQLGLRPLAALAALSRGMAEVEAGWVLEGLSRMVPALERLQEADVPTRAWAHFVMARAYFRAHRQREALKQLAEAARLHGPDALIAPLLPELRRAEDLFRLAERWGVEWPRIWDPLRRIGRSRRAPARAAPPPLEIRAFGPGEVWIEGQPLAWPEARKAWELFFYLLTVDSATREEIGAALWPDAPPARLTGQFHSAKWRLKRILGREVLAFREGRYAFDRRQPHWYDVAMFEEHLRRARAARGTPEALAHLQAAAELYRGDYLSGWNAEWAVELRERLRTRYLEALLTLAEGTLKAGEPAAALAWFQQALAVDPYLEAACLGALRCYLAMGQPAAALALYRQYAARLERDLRLRPSPEARALYESILQAQDRSTP